MVPIEKRKIVIPALPLKVLHRQLLIDKLIQATSSSTGEVAEQRWRYKLIMLRALAGYGKTSLLVDYAQQTSLTCCWYTLDYTDTDKLRFLEHLIACLRYRFPHFSTEMDTLLAGVMSTDIFFANDAHIDESIMKILVSSIETDIREPFVLILSNYHEVHNSSAINNLLSLLLLHLPSQCTMIIESRALPELEISPLLARREVLDIGHDELRLSPQEVCELAHIQGRETFSLQEAQQLATSFDGWITGILLGTCLGDIKYLHAYKNTQNSYSHPSNLQMNRPYLLAYIVEEAFQREQDLYTFLKEMSILRQMTPALCADLFEGDDAVKLLYTLAKHGLFVSRSDHESNEVYICHPIVRELLYEELRQNAPARFQMLHIRAATLFHRSNDYEQAIYHALEGGVQDQATTSIIEAHEVLFAQGHMETLARWIDLLDEATRIRTPRLLLIRANIHLLKGAYINAFALLEAAQAALSQGTPTLNNDSVIARLLSEIAIARSKALFQTGAYSQSQTICRNVLLWVAEDQVELRAEAYTRLGVCANLLGDFSAGVAYLQRALQLRGRQTAQLHSALATTYSLIGNFTLAAHHLKQVIKYWESTHNEWERVNNLIRMGLVKSRQGEIDGAEKLLQEALTISRQVIHFRLGEAYALTSLGELYLDQDLYEKSMHANEEGLILARQMKDRYLINCALYTMAMTYLLMGDAPTAQVLLDDVSFPDDDSTRTRYERVRYELIKSMIMIYKKQYAAAYNLLALNYSIIDTMKLWREKVQVHLQLALCQIQLTYLPQAMQHLEVVRAWLQTSDYTPIFYVELRRLPELERALQTMPVLFSMRSDLRITNMQEVPASQETQPVPFALSSGPVLSVAAPQFAISAFGEPSVLIHGRPAAHWRIARAMELCFYLLHCNRPMNKEHIIDALWPEGGDHVFQTLYSTVHYLRKILGEKSIVSRTGTYVLAFDAYNETILKYDVAIFMKQQKVAREALATHDESQARKALQNMIEVYQGDYVQSFYSDWCIAPRDQLRRDYLQALQHLAQINWKNEQFEESAQYWLRMLEVDPCLEEAHYGLMRCYQSQHKRGLALRQYQRCIDILRQEVGAQPGPELKQFYRELMEAR